MPLTSIYVFDVHLDTEERVELALSRAGFLLARRLEALSSNAFATYWGALLTAGILSGADLYKGTCLPRRAMFGRQEADNVREI